MVKISQAGLIDIQGSAPQVPTQFDADSGSAVPVANVLVIDGLTVANATYAKPIFTTASGNTVVVNAQLSTALTGLPVDNARAGLCSFDDTSFSVDATTGYVTLSGGSGPAVDTNTGDDGVAVSPDAAGNFNWNGLAVANATHTTSPVYFKDATAANTIDLDIQVGVARTGVPGDKLDAGLSSYDDTYFTVDTDGYVSQTQAGIDTACANFIVDPAGLRAEYTTLTSAVAAASSGDTIFVKEGTYTEDTITIDKNLTITAFAQSDRQVNNKVILQGTSGQKLFAISANISLKVTNVKLQSNGANILDLSASLSACSIVDCKINAGAGDIAFVHSSADATNLSFNRCEADGTGQF